MRTICPSTGNPVCRCLGELGRDFRTRFENYLKKKGWDPGMSAQELVSRLRQEYAIEPSWSDDEARKVIGICYELDLRKEEITSTKYVFAENVDITFITIVKERNLQGVQIDTSTVREYHTDYAAHLLGRIGLMSDSDWAIFKEKGYSLDAVVGKDGAERAFESYLRGVKGISLVDMNQKGKIVSETTIVAPQPGNNVFLTLDIKLQEAVEDALARYMSGREQVEGAAAVAIEVSSGDVLASASYPTYNLATFNTDYKALEADPLRPMVNRAFQGTYAPGSTFKMVTAVAGMEEGIIKPETKIRDTGRFTAYQDYQPMCWIYRQYGRTHGLIDVTKALEVSCNVFFYTVAYQLGIERLNQYTKMFGLGRGTGIELPELTGIMAGPEFSSSQGLLWMGGNTLAAAIGQSDNQYTPLQLANYVATLVNGGTHYSAHLLKRVTTYDFGEEVAAYTPQVMDTISLKDSTIKAVKEGMLAVTSPGGSPYQYFKDLNVKVGAKTGSAQVSISSESNAVFVCFAPYDEPKIALAIVVEKGGTGAELGALASEIMKYYFSAESAMDRLDAENTLLR
jgi:penicillin-binding protein 2